MLENRSFDHLLGDAHLQGIDADDRTRVANPVDLVLPDRWPAVPAAPDELLGAHELVWKDPPHSHHAARVAMFGLKGSKPTMRGFVHAYRLKLLGKEHLPTIHWWRIGLAACVLAVFAAAAAENLVERLRSGDAWPTTVWMAVPGVAALVWVAWRRIHQLLVLDWWKAALAGFVCGCVLGLSTDGLRRHAQNGWRDFIPWLVATGVGALALVCWQRRKMLKKLSAGNNDEDAARYARSIMRAVDRQDLPIMSTLAEQYCTFDRWFCSVPGATWPNRNFLHAATSEGSVDIEAGFYLAPTIFELLEEYEHDIADGRPSWRIYRDGLPQVVAFPRLWSRDRINRWHDMKDFHAHARAGKLPSYSFIEPCHSGLRSNSLHPGNNQDATGNDDNGPTSDFQRAEALVAAVYRSLTSNSGAFRKTLLLITCDEHGGWFDHVPPPSNAAYPRARYRRRRRATDEERRELRELDRQLDRLTNGQIDRIEQASRHDLLRSLIAHFIEHKNAPFRFRQLGPRVPTIAVSPWIRPSVEPGNFDHASVVKTLRLLFAPDSGALTSRDDAARSFHHIVTELDRPRAPVDLPATGEARQPRKPGAEAERESRPSFAEEPMISGRERVGGDLVRQLAELEPLVKGLVSIRFEEEVRLRGGAESLITEADHADDLLSRAAGAMRQRNTVDPNV